MHHIPRSHPCLATLLAALAVLACSSDAPVAPRDGASNRTLGPLSLAIVSGDGQSAPVTAMLPAPVEVVVTRDATGALRIRHTDGLALATTGGGAVPVPGQLVRFLADSGCGQAYVGYGITDSAGRARDRWTLGTHAGTCHLMTVGLDSAARPVVYDTATAIALPGPIDSVYAPPMTLAFLGQTVLVDTLVLRASDRWGNPIPQPTPAFAASDGWTVSGRMVTAPSTEAEGRISFQGASRSAETMIAAVIDLRAYRWHATWACFPLGQSSDWADPRGVRTDSVLYDADVDSLSYSWTQVRFALTSRTIYYAIDGVADTVTERFRTMAVRQAPDSLVLRNSTALDRDIVVRTSDAPITYEGGTWCPMTAYDFPAFRPLRLVQQTP